MHTESKLLNEEYARLKTKYGKREAMTICRNALRLVNPNSNVIAQIRSNGIVVIEDGKHIFKPFTGTDFKEWRLAPWSADVSDQFPNP